MISCWVTEHLQERPAIREQRAEPPPRRQRIGVLRRHPRTRTMTPRQRRTGSAPSDHTRD
eukprot:XP_001705599.1 Hypothetical protein GL50803_38224 [Giardia lamblia ATCC 50803]